MRLEQLRIENYGHFHNADFDWKPGLQVIYGPNEAGKSTLLQLVRELLFGFHNRSPYAFEGVETAATARLALADGRQVEFRRRKGRGTTVVGQVLDTGDPLDDDGLLRLLGGASADLYRHVFGFSLEELRSGEQSLQEANLNEALFGGALGGLAGFERTKQALRDEHAGLFSPQAKVKPINSQLKQIRDALKRMKELVVDPAAYANQRARYDELGLDVERLQAERGRLDVERARLERLQQAALAWREREKFVHERAAISVVSSLPAPAELQRLMAESLKLTREADDLQQELRSLTERAAGLSRSPELLAAESAILGAFRRTAEMSGYRADLPKRGSEAALIRQEVARKLRDLNPAFRLETLADIQPTLPARSFLEQLAADGAKLQQELHKQRERQAEFEQQLERTRLRHAELTAGDAPAGLAEAVERGRQGMRDAAELTKQTAQLAQRQAACGQLRKRWQAPPVRVPDVGPETLVVPSPVVVKEFRQQWADVERRVQDAGQRVADARANLQRLTSESAQLAVTHPVPDRQTLLDQRARRDAVWETVRQRVVEGRRSERKLFTAPEDDPQLLADEFARELAAADRLADDRQEKAEWVVQRDRVEAERRLAEQKVAELETALAAVRAEQAAVVARWQELWEPCGVGPASPDVMLEWLSTHDAFLAQRDEAAAAEQRVAELQTSVAAVTQELQALLGRSAALRTLVAQAEELLETHREAQAERRQIDKALPQQTLDVRRIGERIAQLEQQAGVWQARWAEATRPLGIDPTWSPAFACQVIQEFERARARLREAELLETRVSDMDRLLAGYTTDVAALCAAVAPDLAELPPESAAEELNRRLAQARRAEQELQAVQQERQKGERRLHSVTAQAQQAAQRLADLRQQAGAAHDDELRRAVEQSAVARSLDSLIREQELQIKTLRGAEDPATFETELAALDTDSLDSRLKQLDEQRTAVETRYQQTLTDRGRLDEELNPKTAGSAAAEAAGQVELQRAELAALVERWAPLAIAEALLVKALQRFERDHQPAMLRDVGRLLERMTLGRYTGLRKRMDERGSIVVEERGGRLKEPRELSTGTREQLYLAIRLAYVAEYSRRAEPLPLVMDDVLVNFDEDRARQTLAVLAEFADEFQILFLTCHRRTLALAQDVAPSLVPCEIQPPFQIGA